MAEWTALETAVIEEARVKLTRRRTRNAAIAIGGLVATIVSLSVGQGAGLVFFGAMIAGPVYAYQDSRYLRKLDKLTPGTPLNAGTLGVRTSADPPPPSQKRGLMIVGSMLGVVVLAIIVMVVVMG